VVESKKERYYLTMMIPGIAFLSLIIIVPIISTFVMSLKEYNFIKPQTSHWVGLSNYISIVKDPNFWISAYHTLIYVISAVSIEFVLGLAIALLFFNLSNDKSVLMSFILLPSVMSPVVVGLIFRYMLNTEFGLFSFLLSKAGLFKDVSILGNTATALPAIIAADIWQWTPFLTLMLIAGLIALPTEPYEAARIDGAGGFTILFKITLPLLIPVIRVSLMLRIVDVVKEFDKIFVMTEGGPGTASETMNYLSYRVNFRYFNMGFGSAQVIIILLIILAISVVIIKSLKSQGELN
jgi:multiple sugar transport system permease protein